MKNSIKQYFLSITLFLLGTGLYSQHMDITVTHKVNEDKSVDFYYRKKLPGNYIVAVKFTTLKNAHYSDFQGNVKSPTGKLFRLRPISSTKSIIFSYRTYYVLGVHKPKVDHLFSYSLPFKKGSIVQVKSVDNLRSVLNKEKPKSWKAFQFITDQDTIRAIRKGMVVDMIKNNYVSSNSLYSDKKNKIIVEHEDGSYAQYSGFVNDGILVKKGQTILPNMKLGVLSNKSKSQRNNLVLMLYFSENKDITKNSNYGDVNIYINPYFVTSNKKEQLKPANTYTVEFNTDLFTAELTRRQLKKYKKGELKFN